MEGESIPRTHPKYTVSSKSSADFAWDYPAARGKKIVLAVNDARRPVDIMEIGDLMPFKFSVRHLMPSFYSQADFMTGSTRRTNGLVGRQS